MLSLLTYLARFFKESQEPQSKANEDHSRECEGTAGMNAFLALLRKGSDPKSEEVGRVIIVPQYSWVIFGKVLWNIYSCHRRGVKIPRIFSHKCHLASSRTTHQVEKQSKQIKQLKIVSKWCWQAPFLFAKPVYCKVKAARNSIKFHS